jgi:hypothetical protein
MRKARCCRARAVVNAASGADIGARLNVAEPDLRRHGRLRSVDVAQVRARALVDVVGPCAQALLTG